MKYLVVVVSVVLLTVREVVVAQGSSGGNSQDTRLGLLAEQLGVPPVPGATSLPGTGGLVNPGIPPRDAGCWCQPVNQVCTPLRPLDLNLVTRILNRPGSPSSGGAVPNCGSDDDQRICCAQPGSVPPGQSGAITAFCGTRQNSVGSAVSPIADVGEYPWMAVVLGPGQAYVAGGVLISEGWVLTTPHKLTSLQGLSVRLGDYDVSQGGDLPQSPHFEVAVANVVVHPNFNRRSVANDVALLRLAQPVNRQQFPHIVPACLPGHGQMFAGQRCYVSGWGQDAFGPGNFQRLLQEVDVPILNSNTCESLLKNTRLGPSFTLDKRSFLCAGGEQDKDSCQGDGGSPLVCGSGSQGWTVVGLVAWGVGCGQQNVPGVYVNVPSYVNWINQFVNGGQFNG